MNVDRIDNLLFEAQRRDRAAFQELVFQAAPVLAVRLAQNGVAATTAEQALLNTFTKIWKQETVVPFSPDQSSIDWLADMAAQEAHEMCGPASDAPALVETTALWQEIEKAAFDHTWRSTLRRLDLVFAVIAALFWAIIVYFLGLG